MASIICVKGKSRGNYLPLPADGSVVLGRAEDCDLQVQGDAVSRRHLEIRGERGGAAFVAVDAKSANGVFINTLQIASEQTLRDGDVIMIGESELLFTMENFLSRESAMNFYQRGEKTRSTMMK